MISGVTKKNDLFLAGDFRGPPHPPNDQNGHFDHFGGFWGSPGGSPRGVPQGPKVIRSKSGPSPHPPQKALLRGGQKGGKKALKQPFWSLWPLLDPGGPGQPKGPFRGRFPKKPYLNRDLDCRNRPAESHFDVETSFRHQKYLVFLRKSRNSAYVAVPDPQNGCFDGSETDIQGILSFSTKRIAFSQLSL